jgi:hypothetical protein
MSLSVGESMVKFGVDWAVNVEETMLPSGGSGPWCTVREDTGQYLGVVSKKYPVLQNEELFALAYEFSDEVTVENVLVKGQGQRVALLLKANSFVLQDNDETWNYLYLYNGHDGKCCLGFTCTNVRMSCNNQHNMVVSNKKPQAKKIVHNPGNWGANLVAFSNALSVFKAQSRNFETFAEAAVSKSMNREEVDRFYEAAYDILHDKPETSEDYQKYWDYHVQCSYVLDRDINERGFGRNLWTVANSVTDVIQNQTNRRGRKHSAGNLQWDKAFGSRLNQSHKVMHLAASLV